MNSIGDLDILFQNDKNPDKPKRNFMCRFYVY